MFTRFIIYGLLGLAIEVIWTAIYAKLFEGKKNWELKGTSHIWMFFIYGLPVFLFEPVVPILINYGIPWYIRGLVYMIGIFTIEYAAGFLSKKLFNWAPWDYSKLTPYHLHGLIRYDYAPLWFGFGLVLESVGEFLISVT